MIIILDTSIILSYLLNVRKNNALEIIKLSKKKKFTLASSLETLYELKEKVAQPQFQKIFKENNSQVAQFIAWYKYNSKLFEITKKVRVCRDVNDDKFLELALESKAEFLITGDLDLLDLVEFKDTKILKPKDFLNKFDLKSTAG